MGCLPQRHRPRLRRASPPHAPTQRYRLGHPETGTLTLGPSTLDSLHDIPVHDVLMTGCTTGMHILMKPGTTLTHVNPKQYQRYSYVNAD